MVTMTTERRRQVQRFVEHKSGNGEPLRLDQLMEQLQQEVQHVREEQPDLQAYQLYDLTFRFQKDGLMLNLEFRK